MSKDKKHMTKEQLVRELTAAESMAHAVGMERDRMTRQYEDEKANTQELLNKIGTMLQFHSRGSEVLITNTFRHPLVNREVEPKTSIEQIAFRIGQLVLMEREYLDLQDRCLPIPKMQVIADDRNDRRNGGRGSGLNFA